MKILVIAAHADDPETCMGGTIARLAQEGHEVREVVLVPYYEDKQGQYNEAVTKQMKEECRRAANILGCTIKFGDFDPHLLSIRFLVQHIDRIINNYCPDVVFTHWDGDSHPDHVVIAKATLAGTRKNTASLYMYRQLLFGGVTPDAFRGSVYVDISDTLTAKVAATLVYESQPAVPEQIEAIKAMAMFNGAVIGVKYAEVFQPVRVIWKGLGNE